MASKVQTVRSIAELETLVVCLTEAASDTLKSLRGLSTTDPLTTLASIRFGALGCDPLDQERALNFVEQLNQTFTYLATFEAARWLLRRHPDCAPLTLNLGTAAGSDIESECGQFVAETFAATYPDSNNKLNLDVAKVRRHSAVRKFVFYLSQSDCRSRTYDGVTVVQLSHPAMGSLPGQTESRKENA